VFWPVVGVGLQLQHLARTESGAQALQQLRQRVALGRIFQQQTATQTLERLGFQRTQAQPQHRRRQRDLVQALAQQALQVLGALRWLGGAQQQRALLGSVAASVHLPAQLQRQHAALAQLQPDLHLPQQAACAKQQG